MNKKIVLAIVIVAILFFITVVWKSTYSSTTEDVSANKASSIDVIRQVKAEDMDYKTREELTQQDLRKQLNHFKKNPGNITRFMQQLKHNCYIDDCEQALIDALKKYPDQAFAQVFMNLLNRLPQYEKQMQSAILSTDISPKQRFNMMWELREKTLGHSEALLGFGEEQKYANYRFDYQDLAENKNLNTNQKLQAFEDLQLKYLDITKEEGNIAVYEQAFALLKVGKSESELQSLKAILQERYLNEQEKQDIQLRDERVETQTQQAQQYQLAVKKLQDELLPLKAKMNEAEWNKMYEDHLEQLRLDFFNKN